MIDMVDEIEKLAQEVTEGKISVHTALTRAAILGMDKVQEITAQARNERSVLK